MKSYRKLTRFIAPLVVLTLALSISSMLVAGQDTSPGTGPQVPEANTNLYLPLLQKNSNTINGRVKEDGVAAPNVVLGLYLYNAGAWIQTMSTTTNVDGYYYFANANSLLPGQKYKVKYQNPGDDQSRLWTWETHELTSYTRFNTVNIGNFDIANLTLGTPAHLSLVTLPRVFTWTARPATPTDSYEFDLMDYNDSTPSFKSAHLGYAASYNLTTLPPGFSNCIPYAWGLTIYGPDGGWGLPYWYNAVTFYNTTPSGIHGCVAEGGVPKSGIQVELWRLNISTLIDELVTSTTSNSSGYFAFNGRPALDATHWYFVKYPNNEDISTRLWVWYTRHLDTYAAGSPVHIGDFDIANVPLLSPPNGITVNLPETFSWTRRPLLQADSYEFNLFQNCDGCIAWWTDPPLGYASQYTLMGLPAGFGFGTQYRWEVWVNSPYDSAYGISFEARAVTFSATAQDAGSPETLTETQRESLANERMLRNLKARTESQPGLHPDFERLQGQP